MSLLDFSNQGLLKATSGDILLEVYITMTSLGGGEHAMIGVQSHLGVGVIVHVS